MIIKRGISCILRKIKNAMASMSTTMTDEKLPSPTLERPQKIYDDLKDLCHDNIDFFKADDSDNGERLRAAFSSIKDSIDIVLPLVDNIREVAPSFDFDEATPGNGYRSFVTVVDSCILHSTKLGKQVCVARDGLMFRKLYYAKEIEACSQLLASLGSCLHHLHTLLSWSKPGELFADENHSAQQLLASTETINQYCFYGRCLGFQFLPSMRNILKGISICMAGFSEAYYSRSHIINSFWAGGKFMMDPELRARRIVNISQYGDIHFCKSFWFLSESELMNKLPGFVSSPVAVNRMIMIPPEPIEIEKNDGSSFTIQVPDVHLGPQTLHVRLISKVKREGMVGEGTCGHPKSRGLLFHCHGGGFVATSSRSHEVYLREWAIHLDVPILSVDYSLAPRAPFPRALHEVFYAYCWALKNAALLGTTAERIVMAGDSAGANLNMAACIRLVEEGIRLPDGIFLAYAPMLVNFVPSPARLLCLMDPLLPFGFMMRCLKAYACPPSPEKKIKSTTNSQISLTNDVLEKDYLKPSISQDGQNGMLGVSDASSYEEVSESDLVELQAHKSFTSDHLSDTLSGASLSSEHRTLVSPNEEQSQHCVSDFLDKYVLDSDTDSDGQKIPVIKKKSIEPGAESPDSATLTEKSITDIKSCSEATSGDASTQTLKSKGIHTRISEAAGNLVGTVSNTFSSLTSNSKLKTSNSSETVHSNLDALIARNPTTEFGFNIPKDPYLSPYWASDEILKKMPPMSIMTVHLDPCLDDCVMFAKKVRKLGNRVSLDILNGLPHGFLNFSKVNKESHDGCLLCVMKIRELFNMDSLPPTNDSQKSTKQ